MGGRKIEIECGNSVLRAELHDGKAVGSDYYPTKESLLGEISVKMPGEYKIILHTLALTNPEAEKMNFQSLKFQKISKGKVL